MMYHGMAFLDETLYKQCFLLRAELETHLQFLEKHTSACTFISYVFFFCECMSYCKN